MQNSLAIIERVLWDGELAIIISQNDEVVDKFTEYYTSSVNLEVYNNKFSSI